MEKVKFRVMVEVWGKNMYKFCKTLRINNTVYIEGVMGSYVQEGRFSTKLVATSLRKIVLEKKQSIDTFKKVKQSTDNHKKTDQSSSSEKFSGKVVYQSHSDDEMPF